ncbi:MAG: trigger factor [Acidimicrobiales bacterium]
MKSSVEALEGNKVKFTVEVEEAEFDNDLDAAFKSLAREIRLPGFRPGKAPRKVIEARIGSEYARSEAFRNGLPNYYVKAVNEHEVDVIDSPDIEIVEGELAGPVTFSAVVQVRPVIEIDGYQNLSVEIPSPIVSEEDLTSAIERLLGQFGELVTVDRPAQEGDRVTIDISATHEGEPVEGLTANDYVYEVGMGAVVEELDENLIGASAGDELTFSADHPDEDEDEPLEFSITVKDVQETVLPDADDEFAKANTEFDSADALRDDYRKRLTETRVNQANTARRNAVAEAVAELVSDDDIPEALVEMEVENRAQDLAMRLQAQGLTIEQYLQFSGRDQGDLVAELQATAGTSAKMDLALRAVAVAEGLQVTDAEINEEMQRIAEQVNRSAEDVLAQLTEGGQMPSIRADIEKARPSTGWSSTRRSSTKMATRSPRPTWSSPRPTSPRPKTVHRAAMPPILQPTTPVLPPRQLKEEDD